MGNDARTSEFSTRSSRRRSGPRPWREGQTTRRALRLTDLLTLGAVGVATHFALDATLLLSALFVGSLLFWLETRGLYRARLLTIRVDEWRRLFQAVGLSFATTIVIAFTVDITIDRGWAFASFAIVAFALAATRELWRFRFRVLRGSGAIGRRTVLVGCNPEAQIIAEMIEDDASLGYTIVHHSDPDAFARAELLTTSVLAAAAKHDAVSVLVAGSGVEVNALNRLCRDLVEAGIHVELSMSLMDIMHRRLTVRPLGRFPIAYLEPVHRVGWRPMLKRAFDLVVSLTGLLVLAPVLIATTIAVKMSSPGPVVFRQERVGRDGRNFDMLKFRTMVQDAEEQLDALRPQADTDGPLFKMKNDPRITRIGRMLRRTSLDEILQLVNVVRGDMSLVGPRPALRAEMASWSPELYGRLRVRPGITGLWQVSGRSEASFEEYTRLDLYYVDNWSLTADLRILARTATAVARSAGAY